VADKLGVTRTAVSAWEVGRNSPDIVEIIKLKKILEITEDEFFLDTNDTISEQEVEEYEND
jgi:transcriptional regulator with XRE-family HTH domain